HQLISSSVCECRTQSPAEHLSHLHTMGLVQRRPPMTASHVFPSPGLDRLAASDGCPDCPPLVDRISLAARESAMPQFAQKLSVPGRSLPYCGQNIGSPSLLARHVKRHHLEHRSKPLELLG